MLWTKEFSLLLYSFGVAHIFEKRAGVSPVISGFWAHMVVGAIAVVETIEKKIAFIRGRMAVLNKCCN